MFRLQLNALALSSIYASRPLCARETRFCYDCSSVDHGGGTRSKQTLIHVGCLEASWPTMTAVSPLLGALAEMHIGALSLQRSGG
ncbi:hypothetical protein EJ03DRAFT_327063 [Teratosphaeria nubilosa]|uniref:Uncharacterized protein n=1 Tax=Teratosphaeria nubilosa TaxID=161662 RepID=A0A6G1LBH4_9PEZI|nr:hypothetical protein EJ03DRAFT_327063 [Teratosphaeria nubilosa]